MKTENYIIEIFISTMFILLLFYSSDPIIYDDSYRYLKSSLKDPPLYSMVINLMEKIFNSLNSVIILQAVSLAFGIIFFTKTVGNIFKLDLTIRLLISFFLFLPTIKFYNNLLTEPLSNAFSLLFVSFLIKLIYDFKIQNLIWCVIFIIGLLLIRSQFIILYPVILITFLGIFYINRSKKKIIYLTITFVSIFIIHNSLLILNKSINQNFKKKDTILTSYSGVFNFIYIDSIYISSPEDIKLFKSEKLKETVSKIFFEVNKRKALVKYYDGRGHFGLSYAKIRDNAILPLQELAVKENTTVIALKNEIAKTLIIKNYKGYIKLIFKKFYDSTWLFIFVPFFMLLSSLLRFYKIKSNFSLVIIFLSLFSLSNHSVVYLFGRVQPRYLIYSDFILLIFIFISFWIFLNFKKNI